jgi:hypothetical protein
MAPWPLNQDVPLSEFELYTWRDTSILARGQPSQGVTGTGQGVKLGNELSFDTSPGGQLYQLGQVPTIGLALLMDFRCYPNSSVIGSNSLLGLFTIFNPLPPPTEIAPFFTAYTAGGIPPSTGIPIVIDPDQEIIAGGNLPFAGLDANLPRNQFIPFGQGDFVIRVNRANTRWFECAPGAAGNPFNFAEPVTEPSITAIPPGTQIVLHYRGATGISGTNKPWEVADNLDAYGNRNPLGTAFSVSFTGGVSTWADTMAQINGSQYFQCRITMISNIESGISPELTSLGFAFAR